MVKEEIIELFKNRYLNTKTNNYIFSLVDNFKLLEDIPDSCNVTMSDDDINIDIAQIDIAQNIKIDLSIVNVCDILSYVLGLLKKSAYLDDEVDCVLNFNNKFDLLKFQNILRKNGIVVQFIFYNIESLSQEEQMLLNEIYYFNSLYFNTNAFISENNFQTYFLSDDRVLDYRENYTKIKFINRQFETKEFDDLEEEKNAIKMMLIYSYLTIGFWAFSLDDEELERYLERMKALFIKNGLSVNLFSKDENGKYTIYKNYLLSLVGDDDSLGYFNDEWNEVIIEKSVIELNKIFEANNKYNQAFIEWGSYYLSDLTEAFQNERNRVKKLY